jgi:hypothetical protein
MVFHADFWVAAATGAPVIALAAVVGMGEALNTGLVIGRTVGAALVSRPS